MWPTPGYKAGGFPINYPSDKSVNCFVFQFLKSLTEPFVLPRLSQLLFFKLFPMYLFVQLHQALVVRHAESLAASCELLAVAGGIYFLDQRVSKPLDHQGSAFLITLNNNKSVVCKRPIYRSHLTKGFKKFLTQM